MNDSSRLAALLRLNSVSGIPTLASRRLWLRLGARVADAPDQALAEMGELDLEKARSAFEQMRAFDPARELELIEKAGARLISLGDPEYSQLLSSIPDPPLVLYVRGEPDFTAPLPLAFVGSRHPTPYGVRMAYALAKEAAGAGAVVVSGLARGIDSECHRAALDVRGRTWAVLGSGLGRLYPAENARLADRIVASGGVVMSEYSMRMPPHEGCFPRRNRIVSGLCWGTVVVEGRLVSGSLITARLAIEQGREVFAVPGPVDSPLSVAPHLLLSQGAGIARDMKDVWEGLPPGARPDPSLYVPITAPPSEKRPSLSSEHAKILELIGPDARTLEELIFASGLDLPRLSYIIFELELRNLISTVPGQRYAKKGS